ncbi:MAG TPA: hypothetical protein EYG40_11630 [Verrucomicrobia bacterium]|nr:hypothetical protein [Verrucomicrobiales bacterium]HIL55669.1 hypothetical protein [Verrucomicrobiota bacterium]
MMTTIKLFIYFSFFMVISSLGVYGQNLTEIEVETSSDLKVWESLPLREILTADDKLLHRTDKDQQWYRLKIKRDDDEKKIVSSVPLEDVPENLIKIAVDFIAGSTVSELAEDSAGDDGKGWGANSVLADYAYPIYNPGILEGQEPAFYEFVVGQQKDAAGDRNVGGPLSPNGPNEVGSWTVDGNVFKEGSILVSATSQVEPISSFATEGKARVAKLLERAGTTNVKAVWYDVGYIAGEDASGKLIASLGNAPFKIDSTPIIQMLAKGTDSYENIYTPKGSSGPQIDAEKPEFFNSYEEFKKYYLTDPLMVELRDRRAKAAILDWDIANGKQPPLLSVIPGQQRLIGQKEQIDSFDLNLDFEDEQAGKIDVLIQPAVGAIIVGRELGPVILTLNHKDGKSSVYLVCVVVRGDINPVQIGTWTSWTKWFAGNWNDQRLYYQVYDDPEMCPDGASGCGPTAWGMLYGWWDHKGAPGIYGNRRIGDAPLSVDERIESMYRYLFDAMDTWCVPNSSSAATNPWDMHEGRRWASYRSVSISASSSWGVPYVSTGPYKKSRNAIKDGYPAILGIGFYSHYVTAYGYKYRKYRALGITWKIQRKFKCNWGHGDDSPRWHSNKSVWYGQRVEL